MELYEQETEIKLLLQFCAHLSNKSVVDVGAEKGSFIDAFLRGGCHSIYAFEPYPPHISYLQQCFQSNNAVKIFPIALGLCDETSTLHIACDPSGREYDYYHSLVSFNDTQQIHWDKALPITCRSLASLVEAGEIPAQVGILKIDTEGNDYAVVQGMGNFYSDVVMVEYWHEVEILAACPWHLSEMITTLAARGYSNFAFVKRHDEFEILQINSGLVQKGDWGNIVFVHDNVAAQLVPIMYDAAAETHIRLVGKAQWFRSECQQRLEVIDNLRSECQQRLEAIDNVQSYAKQLEAQIAQLEAHMPPVRVRKKLAGSRSFVRAALAKQAKAWGIAPPQVRLGLLYHYLRILTLSLARLGPPHARLGVLYHYPPRPLDIPKHYTKMRPMQSPPIISIVTPSLNQGSFIERTIQSVLGQGYPQLEYLIQDGSSSDETGEILQRYKASLAHCEVVKDRGQAHAVNLGFQRATGAIMAYLNADDVLLPNTLHYVARFFAKHPQVDVVYGHRVLIDAEDREIGRWVMPPHDNAILSWADYIPQETLFWRRQIWEKAGGAMDEDFQFALDWDLLLRFREVGARFVRLPRFLAAFRVHPGQKTSAHMASLGSPEFSRLHERCHGRPVSLDEVFLHIQPYLHRHAVCDTLYRLGIFRY